MDAPLVQLLGSIASRKSLDMPLHNLIGGRGLAGKHFLCRIAACMTFGQLIGHRFGRIGLLLPAGALICPRK
jgi:hypothetical protein